MNCETNAKISLWQCSSGCALRDRDQYPPTQPTPLQTCGAQGGAILLVFNFVAVLCLKCVLVLSTNDIQTSLRAHHDAAPIFELQG